ncbi:MAG TPA: mechanosensitive ion channel domain-containing protein [Desulfosporosinus sp.]|nr:mechanosensitive ion channel domain-containing protein [Desulfosporosinus sp.]
MDMNNLIAIALPIAKNITLATLTFVFGLITIRWITKRLEKYLGKLAIDTTLKPFVISIINVSLKVLLIISIIKVLGIDTTSFVAVIASAGFAVGLAFQGSLSNFSGGVLLLTVRPFKVGDYVEAAGYEGTVQAIQILYTELITVDNKVIFIPNGNLSNTSIINYTAKDTRRLDLKFSVGYEEDSNKVMNILKEILDNHSLVFKNPEPFVRMSEHGDSAIVFTVRVWVNTTDYWTIHFDILETVKNRFDKEKISIPYPQMDVHINHK